MTLGKLTVTDCDGRGRRPRHHQAAVPNVWENKTSCLISPLPKTTCCPRWERLCSSPVCLCSSPFLPIGWRLRPQRFWLEMEEEQISKNNSQCILCNVHCTPIILWFHVQRTDNLLLIILTVWVWKKKQVEKKGICWRCSPWPQPPQPPNCWIIVS